MDDTWHLGEPKSGTRIAALYNDGSGAQLFIVLESPDGGLILIDSDGDEYEIGRLTDGEIYGLWSYLPEGTKLWCELRSDEPIQLADM